MLDSQWSEALASNNIRAIIRWLRRLTFEGDDDLEEILISFSGWTQRMSEFAKKELLTLCFSRCQGLWMFLDQSSFKRVHMLLQRLRNLLTLAQWARRQLSSTHLWHGVGVPCVVCRDAYGSSEVRRSCWSREHRALKQHIWLGQLVQWWGITGLLPKHPEALEVKRIAQMWKEMDHSHRKASLKTQGWEEGGRERWSSFIQAMVTQMDRQHGCIWTSEGSSDQCYPPPNLQALLKLVLVPRIDNQSVQAILMYFILDMANFLQCKDDLLQSFCHAFIIPSSFSRQIRAFWMLDHGHSKVLSVSIGFLVPETLMTSMDLLLSPRAAAPWPPWQHRCIIHCLLARKQPRVALRYLNWTRPAMEGVEDVKLCADVLLQNGCVSDAWALLKRGHTESDDMVMHFLRACNGFGLCAEASKYVPGGYTVGEIGGTETAGTHPPLITKDCSASGRPRPLSAALHQAQKVNTVSPEELVQLVRNAVMEVRELNPKMSMVVWPEHKDRQCNNREMFLSTQALRHLTPSPSPVDMADRTEETTHTQEEENPLIHYKPETPEHISSPESPAVEDQTSASVSSFTSASSLRYLRRKHPHVYESTVTLQRISSLLTDGEHESREEDEEEVDEESRTPSPLDVTLDCPELTVTLDGATDPISLNILNRDILDEMMLSGKGSEEGFKTSVFRREDSVDAFSGASMDETLYLNESSNEDSHSSQLDPQSHSFLSPECGTLPGCKGVPAPWSSAMSLNQDDQLDYCNVSQVSSFAVAAASNCFFGPHPHVSIADSRAQRSEILISCALFDTTQDLLSDLHRALLLEEAAASSSAGSFINPTQPQIPGNSLTPGATCDTQAGPASADGDHARCSKAQSKTNEACVRSPSDHCKMGSWWKQDQETHEASGGCMELRAANTPDERPSRMLPQPHACGRGSLMDLSARQNGDSRDGKQADKEKSAGWRVSQGAIRSRRARSRRGKRVKRAGHI